MGKFKFIAFDFFSFLTFLRDKKKYVICINSQDSVE